MSLKIVDGSDTPEFRIPASDSKGHSARMWFRCIPSMARQVDQIVQSRKFPYRTKGDLLRHALHRHVKWLGTIGEVKTVGGQVDLMLEIIREEEMNSEFSAVFERLDRIVTEHLGSGSEQEAGRLVLVVHRHVNDMPEGYWKGRYRDKLKKRYGKLLSATVKANLGEVEE